MPHNLLFIYLVSCQTVQYNAFYYVSFAKSLFIFRFLIVQNELFYWNCLIHFNCNNKKWVMRAYKIWSNECTYFLSHESMSSLQFQSFVWLRVKSKNHCLAPVSVGWRRLMARNRSSISLLMSALYVRPSPNFSISSSQSIRSCISCNTTENGKESDQGHKITHSGQPETFNAIHSELLTFINWINFTLVIGHFKWCFQ